MQDGTSKIIQRLGGKIEESLITEIYHYLERSKRTSGNAESEFKSKEEEAQLVIEFANDKGLWYDFNHFSVFFRRGR